MSSGAVPITESELRSPPQAPVQSDLAASEPADIVDHLIVGPLQSGRETEQLIQAVNAVPGVYGVELITSRADHAELLVHHDSSLALRDTVPLHGNQRIWLQSTRLQLPAPSSGGPASAGRSAPAHAAAIPNASSDALDLLSSSPLFTDAALQEEQIDRLRRPGRVWRIGEVIGETDGPVPLPDTRVGRLSMVVGRDRVTYLALTALWALASLAFWGWWFQPSNVESAWLYVTFSLVYFYDVTFLPSMYLFFVGKMSRPTFLTARRGMKVALITLCVPSSESTAVIVRQLEALTRVRYPHDSWVLDEGDDPEIRAAAERLGVRYFTRKGVEKYNQPVAPFKAKTKAGNVNSWLDQHGHAYEVFVQFDIDHRPRPSYLDRVLGYFRDPRIAWVQAPSLYGNLENWVARGSAEQELVLQGPLQQGFFGNSETPFIIGSHCTYRTRAVQEIDGFQPTRAEDHLDTVMLASRGYRGVFVPEVLAVGNGPDTFDTYLRQQFAWAYSMMQVMFTFTPRLIWRYQPMQAVQFLFAQTWYTLWSVSMALLFLMPALTLVTDQRPSGVGLLPFLAVSIPIYLLGFVIWWWTRRWHLPAGLRLSWRGVVLHVARWPIVLWAFLNVVGNVKHPYMITPKGNEGGLPTFPLRSQGLYLAVTWLIIFVVWAFGPWDPFGFIEPRLHDDGTYNSEGFVILALWGCTFILLVVVANVLADLVELRRLGVPLQKMLRLRYRPLAVLLATVGAMLVSLDVNAHLITYATRWDGHSNIDTATTGPARATALLREAAGRGALTIDRPASTRLSNTEVLANDRVAVGAFDPWQTLTDQPRHIDHWYVSQSWAWLTVGALRHSEDGSALLLSMGPSPTPLQFGSTLQEVVDGKRDTQLRRLARVIASEPDRLILVRWGHNMDLAGLEPWSGEDPVLYQRAFRHVVELFRAEGATAARWVWSPSGQPNLAAYYPGDDVVDYIGLSIFEDETWNAALGNAPRSFADHLDERYARVTDFGKPIIVAELGVSGPAARQQAWLSEAFTALPAYPQIRAVVYFNDIAPPTRFFNTTPDWRIAPDQLGSLQREP